MDQQQNQLSEQQNQITFNAPLQTSHTPNVIGNEEDLMVEDREDGEISEEEDQNAL